jgi:hypothetical protein
MKKLLLTLAVLSSTPAFALSEGQAAIVGGIIGYALRGNQEQPQPVYQNGYPPAPAPHIIVVPGYGTNIIHQPHVNDICSTATHINGVYDPGRAQWVCRYGGNGR